MKRLRVVLCVVLLSTFFVGCSKENEIKKISQMLTIELTNGSIIKNEDTHGGFHGDGERFLQISFDVAEGEAITKNLANSSEWSAFPLPLTLYKAIYGIKNGDAYYGPLVTNEDGEMLIPAIKNGFYFFYDRHSESEDTGETTELFSRHSYNFTLAIYDKENHNLYYYELDT